MKILVDIGHPAHVHFFRRPIQQLEGQGHQVMVTARAKDVALELLKAFRIPYTELSAIRGGIFGMGREFVARSLALTRQVRRFRPDVMTAIGGIFVGPVGAITRTPSVVFTDTEHVRADRYLTNPFATRICTPDVFRHDLGRRQVRYRGFHELAYLDGEPRPCNLALLERLGMVRGEAFSVVRFVSWQASHDVGHRGLSDDAKERIVTGLERYGRVWISAEGPLPGSLVSRELDIPRHQVHDLLSMARVYLGEGATMATESALLGTPAVYVSPLARAMGCIEAYEQAGLVFTSEDSGHAQKLAESLVADPRTKVVARRRARDFVRDRVDVAEFVCTQLLEVGRAAAPVVSP